MLGMVLLTIIIVLAYLKLSKGKLGEFKKDVVNQVIDELFLEKDLPIVGRIKLAKGIDIKLYGLKYKDEENQVLEDDNLTYAKLVNIINKNIEIEDIGTDDEIELDIKLVDFRDEEYSHIYMELVASVTNFNLAQFVFKGKDKFALFNIEADYIEKMKDHTDEIIHEIFLEVFRLMKENGDSRLFENIEIF